MEIRNVILFSILLFPVSATAKDKSHLWALTFSPALVPVHTFVHESSHAFSAELMNRSVKVFKPYPHIHEGRLYLGRVDPWLGYRPPTQNEELAFNLAPYITDVVMFATTDALLSSGAVDIKTFWGTTLYLFGMVAPMVDFAKGYAWSGDWACIRKLSHSRAMAANILGFVAIAVGIYRFAIHTNELLK
jgi:hypothetical protein